MSQSRCEDTRQQNPRDGSEAQCRKHTMVLKPKLHGSGITYGNFGTLGLLQAILIQFSRSFISFIRRMPKWCLHYNEIIERQFRLVVQGESPQNNKYVSLKPLKEERFLKHVKQETIRYVVRTKYNRILLDT